MIHDDVTADTETIQPRFSSFRAMLGYTCLPLSTHL